MGAPCWAGWQHGPNKRIAVSIYAPLEDSESNAYVVEVSRVNISIVTAQWGVDNMIAESESVYDGD